MPSRHARSIAAARLTVLALIGIALAITLSDDTGLVPDSYVELVSYYTFQINIVYTAVLGQLLWHQWRGTPTPRWVEYGRAFMAANLLIVGVVYWWMVFPLGTEHGVPMVVVMIISHIITPLYTAWEFLVVGERTPLAWRYWWVIAAYPLLWTAAIIVTSAMGEFVPYDHLDPAQGRRDLVFNVGLNVALLCVITPIVLRWRQWRTIREPAMHTPHPTARTTRQDA